MKKSIFPKSLYFVIFTVSFLPGLLLPENLYAESSSSLFDGPAKKEKYFCKKSSSIKNLEQYSDLSEEELRKILDSKINQVNNLRNLLSKKLNHKGGGKLTLFTRIKKERPVLRNIELQSLFQDQNNLLKLNYILSSLVD